MKTIICDIDGTLTNLWPVEKAVLSYLLPKEETQIEMMKRAGISETFKIYKILSRTQITKKAYLAKYNAAFAELEKKKLLPPLRPLPLAMWVRQNSHFQFVYVTGGQRAESLYALEQLGIAGLFDLQSSVDKTSCPFSKKTGLPFKRILKTYQDCFLFTDSVTDCDGAKKVGIPFLQITSDTIHFSMKETLQ